MLRSVVLGQQGGGDLGVGEISQLLHRLDVGDLVASVGLDNLCHRVRAFTPDPLDEQPAGWANVTLDLLVADCCLHGDVSLLLGFGLPIYKLVYTIIVYLSSVYCQYRVPIFKTRLALERWHVMTGNTPALVDGAS